MFARKKREQTVVILPPRREKELGQSRALEVYEALRGTPVYDKIVAKDGFASLTMPTTVLREVLATNSDVRKKFKRLEVRVDEVVKTRVSTTTKSFRTALQYAHDVAEQNVSRPWSWRLLSAIWEASTSKLEGVGPHSVAAVALITLFAFGATVAFKLRSFGKSYSDQIENTINETSKPYKPNRKPATQEGSGSDTQKSPLTK